MQNLYRHFDAEGTLLYVGISLNALTRLSQHKAASHWFNDIVRVEIETFADRETVLEAERKAIYEENPLHNLRRPTPKEVLDAQAEVSKDDLIKRIVQFNPVYDLRGAAEVLDISHAKVKQLIEQKKIGFVHLGDRNTKAGLRPIHKITGWQLIEFIEHWQAG